MSKAQVGGSSLSKKAAGQPFLHKAAFEIGRKALSLIRPIIKNRRYTKAYVRLLRWGGVDIRPFDSCGFVAPSVDFDAYNRSRIHVGANVFLTKDVILLVHDQSATTAYNSSLTSGCYDDGAYRCPQDVRIGNNVFVGMRTVVLPGTTIEDDVVIAAGSVVKGFIPGGGVYAGCPAKRVESIDEYREKLRRRGCFENRYKR